MSTLAWSATREYRLRRRITLLWLGVWLGLLGGLFLLGGAKFYRELYMYAGICWVVALFLFYELNQARAKLGDEMGRLPNGQFHEGSGMLANKPRSTANLTRWIHHVNVETLDDGCPIGMLQCEGCRKLHHWSDAQWIPNFDGNMEDYEPGSRSFQIDPGGGRFVILCPCGLGHFKLKA